MDRAEPLDYAVIYNLKCSFQYNVVLIFALDTWLQWALSTCVLLIQISAHLALQFLWYYSVSAFIYSFSLTHRSSTNMALAN